MSSVNISNIQIYTVNNFTNIGTGILTIQNELVVGGDININATGLTTITESSSQVNYSIKCAGNLNLENGASNNQIEYGLTSSIGSWEYNLWKPTILHDFSFIYSKVDLDGYFSYLNSLSATGGSSLISTTYTLTGSLKNSINIFSLNTGSTISNINIQIPINSNALIKMTSSGNLTLNSLTTALNTSTANNLLFIFNAPILTISNSTISGSIYAPDSDITINNSTITGSIFAKSITILNNVTLNAAYFTGYITAPKIPELSILPISSINNTEAITVTIDSTIVTTPWYQIYYTLDQSTPTINSNQYTTNFNISQSYGLVKVIAKIIGNGFSDGIDTVSEVYGFVCTCSNPEININPKLNIFEITVDDGSKIYYTLDGSEPTNNSTLYTNSTAFALNFQDEQEYTITAIAYNDSCSPSGVESYTFILNLSANGISPAPIISLQQSSTNIPVTLSNNPLDLPNTYVTNSSYSLAEIDGTNVSNPMVVVISTAASSPTIRYTIDGTYPNHSSAASYSSSDTAGNITIPFITIGSKPIRAYVHQNNIKNSPITEVRFRILVNAPVNFDTTSSLIQSANVANNLQTNSYYAIDIGWIGPGVVTDDVAIYEALINILGTRHFERIFNPTFGVSILNNLGELYENIDVSSQLAILKAEIENSDPRIKINDLDSSITYDDSTNSIVVNIDWTNRITGTRAYLPYAYNLDEAF